MPNTITAPTLTLPIFHLNGSGPRNILEDHRTALEAVETAIEQVCKAAPNMRDYYISNDPGAFDKARTEHFARVALLTKVKDELTVIAQHAMEHLR